MTKWSCLIGLALLCAGACSASEDPSPDLGSDTADVLPGGAGADVPCDVANVLRVHCADCHGSTLRLGAPLSLLTPSDFQQLREGATVGQRVINRIVGTGPIMPPPPNQPMPAADSSVLQSWIEQGSQGVTGGCLVEEPANDSTVGGAGVVDGTGMAGSGTDPDGAMQTPDGTGAGMMDDTSVGGGDTMQTPEGGDEANAWSMFGHDLANSRNNTVETTLAPDTVSGLRQLWSADIPGTTSTPAVVDGVVYLPGWDGTVYALRADDGSVLWTRALPDLIDSSPMVTPTQIFVADDAGSLHALAREDGSVQWSKRIDPHPAAHLWSSPVWIEDADLVVVGVASSEEVAMAAEHTFRGNVVGVSASDGNERFRFYTTADDASSGAGVAVWATPAVDTERKTLYVGTGNNYEPPAGELSDSMLAINYETGALVWSHQFTANDVFLVFSPMGPDFDIGSSANLFSVGDQDLVGIGSKSGTYFALDRDTGVVQWMQQVSPGGVLGGVISASAYADGLVFVAGNDMAAGATRTSALDVNAGGSILWTHDGVMTSYGGVAHANGVVYLGTTGGVIYAIDGATGEELWSDTLPDSIAGSPVVADGVLYVPWGYQWTLSNGMPGNGGLVAYGL